MRAVIILLFLSRNLLIFFFFFYLLFCAGSSLLAISPVAVSKGHSSCRSQALEGVGSSSCSTWAQQLRFLGPRAQTQSLGHMSSVALEHMGYSGIRDQTCVFSIAWRILYHWATREAPEIYWSLRGAGQNRWEAKQKAAACRQHEVRRPFNRLTRWRRPQSKGESREASSTFCLSEHLLIHRQCRPSRKQRPRGWGAKERIS